MAPAQFNPAILFVLFAALVVVVAIIGHLMRERRRKELRAWAHSRGLSFDSSKDRSLDNRYPAFKCLRHGSSRYAYNRMTGDRNGRRILAFDYHYVTGSGKNRSHHHFSAVIVHSPLPLKPLIIRPEGVFDRMAGFFGFDDIDFESAEFSREFYVQSDDRRWAYDVLHAQTIQYLMSRPRYAIQFDAGCVIASRSRRFTPAEFTEAAELIEGLLDRLPDYVRQELGGRSEA